MIRIKFKNPIEKNRPNARLKTTSIGPYEHVRFVGDVVLSDMDEKIAIWDRVYRAWYPHVGRGRGYGYARMDVIGGEWPS